MPEPQEPEMPVALAAPDAFKGTASASDLADAVARGAADAGWAADRCALSDGGEGFAEVVSRARAGSGAWRDSMVCGPLGRPVPARWWLGRGGRGAGGDDAEAVIESAAASGLPLAGGAEGNDPMAATSRGTGELLVAASRAGARRILLGVGGTAMTDGGLGALDAVEAAGGLAGAELVVACDVDATFLDAATRFGPQKGADPAQVAALRDRLAGLAARYRERYGVDVEHLAGAGAAGGLAGGLAAAGARLVPGFEVVADAVGLRARLAAGTVVVTGEGRLDATSWAGKVVGGVLRLAAGAGVAAVVVAGEVDDGVLGALGPPGASARVISLSARFGLERSMDDPLGCVTEVVAAVLSERP